MPASAGCTCRPRSTENGSEQMQDLARYCVPSRQVAVTPWSSVEIATTSRRRCTSRPSLAAIASGSFWLPPTTLSDCSEIAMFCLM